MKNLEFFSYLIKTKKVSEICSEILYLGEQVSLGNIDTQTSDPYSKSVHSLRLTPSYFKFNLRNKEYRTKAIAQQNWGYSVFLNSVKTIDEYLDFQFKSKYRSIIRRYVRRLETCFNIEYRLYHTKIEKDEYYFLMEALYNMLTKRFKQRDEIHKNIGEWDDILERTLPLIISGKASLFVIYNGDEPIEISLNYHFDKILFSTISSYDIDYSKFGLGHVEIYKQLEWCLKNDYILFEMGVGGMDYKRRWSNNIYNYEHRIVYKKPSLGVNLQAAFEINKIRLKEYLKTKKLNTLRDRFFELAKKNRSTTLLNNPDFGISKIKDSESSTLIKNLLQVDFKSTDYSFLKKYVNDFLYSTEEHVFDVKAFKVINKDIFLIKGKNYSQKIMKETERKSIRF
ncbi:GNAT family N-acetyltransferase [Flagellimonas sp. 389]|uniref:GNAT family N-acetyltransferase n=1 Tax=Flagellimonas sp. 389 TaxID=2835862 RepID=UPI001BD626AF|nr:GNAT family N-acetyltransferase [Flagellimonas sp. 389]MBS9463885.1 GNAT family N-acetyltransferase [Flagellimonas sp. 389]